MELWHLPILIAGGFVCGVMNALAGGGSFVTLPLLLFIGLPPQIANATNRVAILFQCVAGTATYHRHRVLLWRHVPPLAFFLVLGAVPGAYLASHIDESAFRLAAAVLMGAMATTVFVDPRRWAREKSIGHIRPLLYPLFFVLGIYCGFLQAGIGVLLISTFVLAGGYDVVHGNALKFALAMIFTATALVVFTTAGHVEWLPGLAVGVGTTAGGIAGARLVILKGAPWVRVFVVLAAAAAIFKLLTG